MPYQRKKLKRYREGPVGYVQSQMVFEPYELDRETLAVISKTVYDKLKRDEDLLRKVEGELFREKRYEEYRLTKKEQPKSEFDFVPKELEVFGNTAGPLSEFDRVEPKKNRPIQYPSAQRENS